MHSFFTSSIPKAVSSCSCHIILVPTKQEAAWAHILNTDKWGSASHLSCTTPWIRTPCSQWEEFGLCVLETIKRLSSWQESNPRSASPLCSQCTWCANPVHTGTGGNKLIFWVTSMITFWNHRIPSCSQYPYFQHPFSQWPLISSLVFASVSYNKVCSSLITVHSVCTAIIHQLRLQLQLTLLMSAISSEDSAIVGSSTSFGLSCTTRASRFEKCSSSGNSHNASLRAVCLQNQHPLPAQS